MKNKKIIIGLALGVGAYLLWNMKKNKSVSKTESVNDKDTSNVKKGGNGASAGANLTNDERKMDSFPITEQKKIELFKQANNYYRGGARPPKSLIDSLKIKRDEALSRINSLGLFTEFKAWRNKESLKNKNIFFPMAKPMGIVNPNWQTIKPSVY